MTEETIVEETTTEEVLPQAVADENPEPEVPAEGDPAPVEPKEYVPNHKYSYMDEEFEFDDKTKGYIKNKEDEDYFRDLITANKAHGQYKELGGIRDIQSKLGEYDGLVKDQKEFQALNNEIDTLGKMLQNGEAGFEQFKDYMKLDEKVILNWAIKKAKAMEDPAYGQQVQQQYSQHAENFNLQQQNELMQNSINEQRVQQFNVELNSGLEGNEVAQAYDNLVGKPGSFRQAVIDYGQSYHLSNQGRDVSIQEAISTVTQRFQGLVANQSVGTQAPNPQTQVQTQVATPEQTVVINQGGQKTLPNIKSGSQTPARKAIKSLADIKAAADALD